MNATRFPPPELRSGPPTLRLRRRQGGNLDLDRFRPGIETQEIPESGSEADSQDADGEKVTHEQKTIYPQISPINADKDLCSASVFGPGINLRKSAKSADSPELPESGCGFAPEDAGSELLTPQDCPEMRGKAEG